MSLIAPPSLVGKEPIEEMIKMCRETDPRGAIVELGVYKGGTAWHLVQVACEQSRRLLLFDTFTGIPEAGPLDTHKIGDFGDTSVDAVREAIPDAEFFVGKFPDSRPMHLPIISFVHLDCDQYETTRHALHIFSRRMVFGGIIWLDDYNALESARRAVEAVFPNHVKTAECGHKYIKV